MMTYRSVLAAGVLLATSACGHDEPLSPASSPTLTAANCPCASAAVADGGAACGEMMMRGSTGMMGHGMGPGMMGGGPGGPMMQGGPMRMGPLGVAAPAAATPLSDDAKSALLRALDEEYRAESLYGQMSAQLGTKRPLAMIARSEQRHAWVLESLALVHGVELPANAWLSTKPPAVTSVAAACRAGVDSEKKTITLYDELLKLDLPADLRHAFTNLRAASAEHHLKAFEACR